MNEKEIQIETDNSFLEFPTLIKIVDLSVNDIKDKLLEKQPILMFGKRSIRFFSKDYIGYKYSKELVKSQKLTENLN